MTKLTMSVLAGLALAMGGVATYSVLAAPTAEAQSSAKAVVDAAIAKGEIGETAGGYLAAVTSISSEQRRAMNEINIGRKSVYTQLAAKQGVSVEVVAAYTGEKQLAKAAPGAMIMTSSGQWSRK